MKFKLKANPRGQFYFPKEIRDEWGQELELIPDVEAGVIYPSGMPAKKVLKSLQVVITDLTHRAEIEEKEA
jgi:bifunctional DNA-binding transcriptional regulator/antitoxin component of YhaV-PrlF toxin-antitoxin module